MKKGIMIAICIALMAAGILLAVAIYGGIHGSDDGEIRTFGKPVIYLYPQEETEVTVKLIFDGTLTSTYPAYEDGWTVTAYPDGTLYNHQDGREYASLFWEGEGYAAFSMDKGFVVKGADTATFLQEKLAYLGLTVQEANEFIMYWLPLMEHNAYNLIAFQQEAYTEHASLEISPAPDSMLRVFMTFKPLNQPVQVEEQILQPFVRNGFSVVEWGGTELK